METIHAQLAPLATDECPLDPTRISRADGHLDAPRAGLRSEIRQLDRDGRLRAPVFLGLRPDIDPTDCVRESRRSDPSADAAACCQELKGSDARPLTVIGLSSQISTRSSTPKDGIVKRDLLNYYDAVAPLILPHLKDRPLSLKRYPNGIDERFFFQKEPPRVSPSGCAPRPLRTRSAT